jgi:hypothetical protein
LRAEEAVAIAIQVAEQVPEKIVPGGFERIPERSPVHPHVQADEHRSVISEEDYVLNVPVSHPHGSARRRLFLGRGK